MAIEYDPDYASSLFPDFDEPTTKKLFYVDSWITIVARAIDANNTVIAFFCSLILIFHIVILCQKQMRKSVINECMLATSISYFVYMTTVLETSLAEWQGATPECQPPLPLFVKHLQNIFYTATNYSRRCSTWLGISMALIRLIILKSSTDSRFRKITELKNGRKLILFTVFLAIPLSIFYFLRFKIEEYDPWTPAETCSGFPKNYSTPYYGLVTSALFEWNDSFIYQVYLFLDGTFSKAVPGILYPILTVVLIRELQSARKLKNGTVSTRNNEKTTRLVAYMTLSHLFSDLPVGILAIIQSWIINISGFFSITTNLTSIFMTIFMLNSVFQCFIYYAISQQYRETSKDLLATVRDVMNPGKRNLVHGVFRDCTRGRQRCKVPLTVAEPNSHAIASLVNRCNVVIAVVATLIVTFHSLVLSQKSMRKTVINMCLLAVAVNYLLYMVALLETRIIQMEGPFPECHPPLSLTAKHLQNIVYATSNYSRRFSTWLGILMSSTRLIILKSANDSKFHKLTEPRNGAILILCTFFLALPLTILSILRYDIKEYEPWVPPETCSEYPKNYSEPNYGLVMSELFTMNNAIVHRIYYFLDGTFSKIVPGILFPMLTMILIRELRLAQKIRNRIGPTGRTDKTTKLVTYMTLSHMSSDLPVGITTILQSLVVTAPGLLLIVANINSIFMTIFMLNSIIQCFICYSLSQNYRETVRELITKTKKVIGKIENVEVNLMFSEFVPAIR